MTVRTAVGTIGSGLVVLAEDDTDIRDLATLVLEGVGLSVIAVRDGAEALAECRRAKPRLLMLGIGLRGTDGPEVCRAVRADPELAELPVVLMTARAQAGDVQAGMDAGADDYIIKPFGPIELQVLFESGGW
jgi:two-component system response regulator MtrA